MAGGADRGAVRRRALAGHAPQTPGAGMIAALAHLPRAARLRVVLDTLAIGAPAVLAGGVAAWRLAGPLGTLAVGAAGLGATAWTAWKRTQRFDRAWLTAALDARAPGLEDSSDLLFAPPETLTGLAALQQARLRERLKEAAALDLRPAWSRRAIAASVTVSAVVIAAAALWPAPGETGRSQGADAPAPLAAPHLTSARLRITPPAYTGQRPFEQSSLDVRAPAGSQVAWGLGFLPHPDAATLTLPGETALPLRRDGGRWSGARAFERSALYRIEAPGLPRQRLHRLEMIPDTAPVVRVVTPTTALSFVGPGQTRWTPVFEARDDYGVAATATLKITVTKGEGENITTTERTVPVSGQGEARRKRFSLSLDLAREGLTRGGDLIVQLIVRDNRQPTAQTVEGPSVILRWPTAPPPVDGLEGMARKILPVYFRSQRQIIIDAEALLARKARLSADKFMDSANGLGEDQAQLRLRYGQFMGEEAEGGGGGVGLALPTSDAPALDLPTNDGPAAPAAKAEAHDDHDHDHGPGDGHDHGEAEEGSPLGDMDKLLAQFGHAHDSGDAATLFSPSTRATLAQALDAMWDSERALRQGQVKAALPHANRALVLLKTAQQATRIYLARTPPKLPPIDLSRRMSGKRDGIVSGRLAPLVRDPADSPAVEAWRALGQTGPAAAPPNLDALTRWVGANAARLPDALSISAAIDTVRNEPQCQDCRRKLRALLWTALERPTPGVQRRAPVDPRGRLYLDALR
ncbi:hypothetical protein CC_2829 [Caulobacter vibrioides CB15]|uniref:DUF4175 domain-containing protein n=2 Tax=Caulobacter vibrioides TaxID=155892 RepID=Q9A4K2_CAUVC|nr:hypothetical protein CC_2829 [Caulobacter vibrioides CB15]